MRSAMIVLRSMAFGSMIFVLSGCASTWRKGYHQYLEQESGPADPKWMARCQKCWRQRARQAERAARNSVVAASVTQQKDEENAEPEDLLACDWEALTGSNYRQRVCWDEEESYKRRVLLQT